jgi:hypothetical protein
MLLIVPSLQLELKFSDYGSRVEDFDGSNLALMVLKISLRIVGKNVLPLTSK